MSPRRAWLSRLPGAFAFTVLMAVRILLQGGDTEFSVECLCIKSRPRLVALCTPG